MISGQALAIALAAALTWYVGAETVKGVKWVGHKIGHAIHAVVHPHEAPQKAVK